MDTWNKRLALALKESGLSANAASVKIGVKPPTFSAWIGAGNSVPAKDIKADNLLAVCELLGVRPEWVVHGRLPKQRGETWPFEGVTQGEFSVLPARERARISRFIRDTVDDWMQSQKSEDKKAG